MDIKALFAKRIQAAEKESEVVETVAVTPVETVRTSLREVDVGITEFVSDLPGFRGVIKQRFSDFNVHEIDKQGNIVVLNSVELPDESVKETAVDTSLLSEAVLSDLEKLVDGVLDNVEIDVSSTEKEERTAIHRSIKSKYGALVTSNTVDVEDKKLITVVRNEKNSKDTRRPGHLPKYLHFVLSKTNTDNTTALSVISSKLRVKIDNLQIAGTKDKRANTSQKVSIKNTYAKSLKNLKGLRNIFLGNYEYKDDGLSLGDLKGNNFQIALRDIDAPEETIENSLKQLKERGFINYFGMQRFGNNAEAATHLIGRHIIKEEFKQAVQLILKPRQCNEGKDLQKAREIYLRTRDAGLALNVIKNPKSVEGKILTGLTKNGVNAFVNALDCLPRNVQLLYLHAYQAFLWNKVASRRIRTYGLAVQPGDLVYKDKQNEQDETSPPVRKISQDEVENFTIYDIVLPIPGADSLFPDNEISNWFRDELEKDELTIEGLKGRIKKYSVSGSYRKLLKLPQNFTWKFARYHSPQQDLILSDAEIMAGLEVLETPDAPLRAVILNITLDASVYATMALREILRADTSVESQTQMNGTKRTTDDDEDDESVIKKPRIA